MGKSTARPQKGGLNYRSEKRPDPPSPAGSDDDANDASDSSDDEASKRKAKKTKGGREISFHTTVD